MAQQTINNGEDGVDCRTAINSNFTELYARVPVTDSDKGDITVSSSGTVWTIDNNVVTYAKMQDVSGASLLLGRGSAGGAGDPQEITVGTGLSMSGTTLAVSDSPDWIKQSADYTLNSVNTQQKLFNESTNGALTIATGTYQYEILVFIDTMNATSGNAAFSMLGAGTATIDRWMQAGFGIDNNNAMNNAFSLTGSAWNSTLSPASVVTAAVGTAMYLRGGGTFRCSAGGTIIPSVTLVTANAAVVKTGSYFTCRRLGASNVTTGGAWS